MLNKQELRKNLHYGIVNNELYAVFQPEVSAHDQLIYSIESLVRWRHHDQEVPLSEFCHLLQEDSLGHQVFRFMLKEAVNMLQTLKQQEMQHSISVNISTPTLALPDHGRQIVDFLAQAGVSTCDIKFELVECVDVRSDKVIQDNINCLKSAGYEVLLDDFGAGGFYMSNSNVVDFDAIKLDRDLCSHSWSNKLKEKIIISLSEYGRQYGKKIIAEGVETEEQYQKLRAAGVNIFQGYLFAFPMRKENLIPWITSFTRGEAAQPPTEG